MDNEVTSVQRTEHSEVSLAELSRVHCPFNPVYYHLICEETSALLRNIEHPGKCANCPSTLRRCSACVRLGSNALPVAAAGGIYCEFHRTHGEYERIPGHVTYNPVPLPGEFSRRTPSTLEGGAQSGRTRVEGEREEKKRGGATRAPLPALDEPLNPEAAAQFVRAYLDAPRQSKPSLYWLIRAVKLLFETYGDRPVDVGRAAQVRTDNGLHVLTKARQMGFLIPAGLELIKKAEAAGYRLSGSWAHETSLVADEGTQKRLIQAKAGWLKRELNSR